VNRQPAAPPDDQIRSPSISPRLLGTDEAGGFAVSMDAERLSVVDRLEREQGALSSQGVRHGWRVKWRPMRATRRRLSSPAAGRRRRASCLGFARKFLGLLLWVTLPQAALRHPGNPRTCPQDLSPPRCLIGWRPPVACQGNLWEVAEPSRWSPEVDRIRGLTAGSRVLGLHARPSCGLVACLFDVEGALAVFVPLVECSGFGLDVVVRRVLAV
jgi:hypothetical protein